MQFLYVPELRAKRALPQCAGHKRMWAALRVLVLLQIGKAFRNEITPRNFIFRSREFEQMEVSSLVQRSAHVHINL